MTIAVWGHSRGMQLGWLVLLYGLLSGCGKTRSADETMHADPSESAPQTMMPAAIADASSNAPPASDTANTAAVLDAAVSPSPSSHVDAGGTVAAAEPDCSAVDCPHCDLGERAVMMPGQCCPTACEPIPSVDPATELDADACAPAETPGCYSNNWPYCTLDWQTAESWYDGCPSPLIGAYLATCGSVDAIIVPVADGSRRFFYDAFGQLVGFESVRDGVEAHCEAYMDSFALPTAPCVPRDAPCPAFEPQAMNHDLSGIGAETFVTWAEGETPDCTSGQAAYDAYLADQLATYNTCDNPSQCQLGPISMTANPCGQPCDMVLGVSAINSQIIARLDTFGYVACAACMDGPQPACQPAFGAQCVDGHCSP